MVMGKQSQRPLGSPVPSGLGRFPPHQTGDPRLLFHPRPTTTCYVPWPVPAPTLVASHEGMGVNKAGEGRIHSLCPALDPGPPSPPALRLGPNQCPWFSGLWTQTRTTSPAFLSLGCRGQAVRILSLRESRSRFQ